MINYKLFLLYMIESFFMVYVGIGVFGLKIEIKRIVSIVLIYGMTIYSVRGVYEFLKISLGTHTLIVLCIFTLCNIFIIKMSGIQAISTTYIGSTLQAISEWLITVPIVTKYDLTVNTNMFETWEGICIGLTGYTLLMLLAMFFFIKKNIRIKAKYACKTVVGEAYEK